MATSVIMPALEMAQESGRLLRWLKQAGEDVRKGEPIMEVETDKVTVEIPSPGSGVLGGILIKEGDLVPVGQTIAWLLAPGETPPTAAAPVHSGRTGAGMPSVGREEPRPTSNPAAPRIPSVEISPLARKIAEQHGVDLSHLP